MTEFELLSNPEILEIVKSLDKIKIAKENAGYNLFTISSYNSYLENFHSDIIASLLNPESLHAEGHKHLNFFIEFLQNEHGVKIESSEFKNATVLREKGRLDVWIKDEESRASIIIENKINNAPDRDNQLSDYLEYATKNKFNVKAIVYLSKNGMKTAPYNNDAVKGLVKNVAAYKNKSNDLCLGWLQHCLNAATNDDNRSFIYQYRKLLTHLSNNAMETNTQEMLYKFINENNALETISSLVKLYGTLSDFRAVKFESQVKDISPFKNRFFYQKCYVIFEKYEDKNGSYKLDVWFNQEGSGYVVMWNTSQRNDDGQLTVKNILERIGLINEFVGEPRYNGLTAEFKISDKYPNIEAIDNAVLNLVKAVFSGLKNL